MARDSAKYPFWPFDVDAWKEATAEMNLVERYVYHELLGYCWTRRSFLDPDLDRLAVYCNAPDLSGEYLPRELLKDIIGRLLAWKFQTHPDSSDHLTCQRILADRRRIDETQQARARGAAKTNAKRWGTPLPEHDNQTDHSAGRSPSRSAIADRVAERSHLQLQPDVDPNKDSNTHTTHTGATSTGAPRAANHLAAVLSTKTSESDQLQAQHDDQAAHAAFSGLTRYNVRSADAQDWLTRYGPAVCAQAVAQLDHRNTGQPINNPPGYLRVTIRKLHQKRGSLSDRSATRSATRQRPTHDTAQAAADRDRLRRARGEWWRSIKAQWSALPADDRRRRLDQTGNYKMPSKALDDPPMDCLHRLGFELGQPFPDSEQLTKQAGPDTVSQAADGSARNIG